MVDCFPQAGTFELKDGNIITNMKVSANWIGNTNNDALSSIALTTPETDENTPSEFVAVEGANVIVENNNNNSSNNTSLPNNVVIDGNIQASNTTVQENTQSQIQVIPRTEPIVLHTTLDIDKTYYFWTKDSYGNTAYQAFVIHKAVI